MEQPDALGPEPVERPDGGDGLGVDVGYVEILAGFADSVNEIADSGS
jgi:hypothetical protein